MKILPCKDSFPGRAGVDFVSNDGRGVPMINLRRLLPLAACVAVLLSAVPALGQETAAALQGAVTVKSDKSPLPGVSVEAVHVPTGTRYAAVTTANGRFNILNVRVGGPYTVTAKIGGFKTETQKDVIVALGEKRELEFALELAARAGDRQRDGRGRAADQPEPDGVDAGGLAGRDQGAADDPPAVPGLRQDEPLRQRRGQRPDADEHLRRRQEQPLQHDSDRRRGQQRPVRPRRDRHPGRPDGHAAHLARHDPGDPGRDLALRRQAGRLHGRRDQRDHEERDERVPRLRLRLLAERELDRKQGPAGRRRRGRQAARDLHARTSTARASAGRS